MPTQFSSLSTMLALLGCSVLGVAAACAGSTEEADQKNLRKLKERFFPSAERYMIAAYSHPPYNLPELEARLQEYVADKTARFRVLNAVRANMD